MNTPETVRQQIEAERAAHVKEAAEQEASRADRIATMIASLAAAEAAEAAEAAATVKESLAKLARAPQPTVTAPEVDVARARAAQDKIRAQMAPSIEAAEHAKVALAKLRGDYAAMLGNLLAVPTDAWLATLPTHPDTGNPTATSHTLVSRLKERISDVLVYFETAKAELEAQVLLINQEILAIPATGADYQTAINLRAHHTRLISLTEQPAVHATNVRGILALRVSMEERAQAWAEHQAEQSKALSHNEIVKLPVHERPEPVIESAEAKKTRSVREMLGMSS